MTREQLIEQLLQKFRAVFHGIRSNMHSTDHKGDLTSVEINILMRVGHQTDGISASELASQVGITGGAVTQIVDKLLEKDLVVREEDPKDRRGVRISLSTKARRGKDEMKVRFFSHFKTVFDDLTDQELEQFINLLNKVKVESKNNSITH